MNKRLIDTNVFVDALRGQAKAKEFFRGEPEIICSAITAAELLTGARDKAAQRKLERALKEIEVLPLTPAISEKMLQLIEQYALSRGLQIADALIAATALVEKLTLVSGNVKHFSFIKGLELEDWGKDGTSEVTSH